MKTLKRIGLIILGLIVLLLATALFVKKEYSVEREVIVNKPKDEVFRYIKYAKNQDHYNKWIQQDPDVKKEFRGTDGTVGFVYAWDGNSKAGKGEQEIKNIEEGNRVDLAIHFIKPMEGNANAWLTTDAISGNQTRVKWGMQGRTPYPFNLMNFFIPHILGKDLQTSLTKLKTVLEN